MQRLKRNDNYIRIDLKGLTFKNCDEIDAILLEALNVKNDYDHIILAIDDLSMFGDDKKYGKATVNTLTLIGKLKENKNIHFEYISISDRTKIPLNANCKSSKSFVEIENEISQRVS